jgi:hypothetical protein
MARGLRKKAYHKQDIDKLNRVVLMVGGIVAIIILLLIIVSFIT